MPEGDTLFKVAARLTPALQGHVLTRFEAPRLRGHRPALGERIALVEARGKHLLIHFERGLVLRTHLRMTGSWHVYRERQRWQKPAYLARAVVGADSGWLGVCFQAPVVETYHRAGAEPDVLASLGPDLCLAESLHDDVIDAVVQRIPRLAPTGTTVGEALLDQRIAAGIGNVYKSEACFAVGIDPGTPIDRVDDRTRRAVWTVAARQLQANLDGPERRTHPTGLAVYGRRGQPCRACGKPIRMARHGDQARSSYWCPACQPMPT
ncbi:MAG: DNA-formamidopyrimidine glycosylase family protein [Acidimicrobiales bacterium]|nr:DNA-formamidopyrimidine glycosylase family protein [Acidimicrobiales bacterium]